MQETEEKEQEKDKELKKYKLLLAFLQEVLPAQEQNKVMYQTVNFIVRKFKLNNAFLIAENLSYRYHSSKLNLIYEQVEDIVKKQIRNAKTAMTVNLKTDFLLKEIKNKEKLPRKAMAYPLLAENEIIGYLFLYMEEELQNREFLPELLTEVTRLIKQVTDFERVKETSVIDSLTELYNRNHLKQNFDKILEGLKQEKKPISILLFDIDNFKKYNDTHGHPEGDKILKKIAETTKQVVKGKGMAYRYGGEEFLVLMPGLDSNNSKELAEELRKKIGENNPLTVSVGLVTNLHSNIGRIKLIQETDKALYQAKKKGKNRTVQYVIVNENLIVDTEKV